MFVVDESKIVNGTYKGVMQVFSYDNANEIELPWSGQFLVLLRNQFGALPVVDYFEGNRYKLNEAIYHYRGSNVLEFVKVGETRKTMVLVPLIVQVSAYNMENDGIKGAYIPELEKEIQKVLEVIRNSGTNVSNKEKAFLNNLKFIEKELTDKTNVVFGKVEEVLNEVALVEQESERFLSLVRENERLVDEKYHKFDTDITEANQTIEDILALQPQFQAVLDETTGKDVISAPELIAARNGKSNLKTRLDDEHAQVTAQLAHKAEQDALNVEKARIDTLIALPDGSTTNDARLEDITAGADGITYDSPGNAVRGQYSKVNSKIERFKDNLRYIGLTETDSVFTVKENAYASSSGYIDSSGHDSYEVTLQNETTLYFESYDTQYTSLCVFTSGIVGGAGYTRYRTLAGGENTLPTTDTRITLPPGTVIIVSVSKANGNFNLMQNGGIAGFYLSNAVKLNTEQIKQFQSNANTYLLTYINNELEVIGNGVECVFNTTTFTGQDGLFELQNLTYNNNIIFGTNNDYIGPLRVTGEAIKGAKHDGEVTDSVLITTDKGTLTDGQSAEASKFTVFVKSHISDEFSRVSSYAFDGNAMTTHSIITTLKNLQIDYVFGTGIISCQDDVNVAWLNKQELTKDVLIGLNEETSIICNHGTLISKRLSVNSDYGDQRVAFNVYSGRKKLYYYTCYGNNIAVPSGSVFASSTELAFS